MNKTKDKKASFPIINILLVLAFIISLGIDTLLIIKTFENHKKEEALFSMDYYKKEEAYKAFNDVFNYYSGIISKEDAIELGDLVRRHNNVNKKDTYQIRIKIDSMLFILEDDIDYSKYKECIFDENYSSEIKYDETTSLVNEIVLTKVETE